MQQREGRDQNKKHQFAKINFKLLKRFPLFDFLKNDNTEPNKIR